MVGSRLAAVFAIGVVGCSGSSSPGDDEPVVLHCADDPRATNYAPGLSVESRRGMFSIAFDAAAPAPPARGDNTWRLLVRNAIGAPYAAADVRVKAWMPDHGHGTTPLWHDAVEAPTGTYEVGPFRLFMNGLWEMTVEVTDRGDTDEVVLAFCIADGPPGRDGGVPEDRDGGPPPPECNATAPTSCADPDLRYDDIAPIVEARCVACHDGAHDLWPLTSYEHVADWYAEIRSHLLDCTMPPPEATSPMTDAERARILLWIRCGFRP